MKNYYLKHITIFLLGGIIAFVMCYFFLKPYWENLLVKNPEASNTETTLGPGEGICGKGIFECPELTRINDKFSDLGMTSLLGEAK